MAAGQDSNSNPQQMACNVQPAMQENICHWVWTGAQATCLPHALHAAKEHIKIQGGQALVYHAHREHTLLKKVQHTVHHAWRDLTKPVMANHNATCASKEDTALRHQPPNAFLVLLVNMQPVSDHHHAHYAREIRIPAKKGPPTAQYALEI